MAADNDGILIGILQAASLAAIATRAILAHAIHLDILKTFARGQARAASPARPSFCSCPSFLRSLARSFISSPIGCRAALRSVGWLAGWRAYRIEFK